MMVNSPKLHELFSSSPHRVRKLKNIEALITVEAYCYASVNKYESISFAPLRIANWHHSLEKKPPDSISTKSKRHNIIRRQMKLNKWFFLLFFCATRELETSCRADKSSIMGKINENFITMHCMKLW